MLSLEYLDKIFNEFSSTLEDNKAPLPAVSLIALENNDPYRILCSTLLSLRTRDEVTLSSSLRLFSVADNVYKLNALSEEEIAEIIKPSGFYKRKAKELKSIASIIIDKYDGRVPSDLEQLIALPGVGIKTASLVLNLGFNLDAICVDCHVHEIVNRLGWVKTKSAEETEKELRKIMPRKYWISLNELLVRYGQYICTPISPYCSKCKEEKECPKFGVNKSR